MRRLTAILIIIGGVYFATNNARTVNTVANNRGNIPFYTVNSFPAMGQMEPKKTFAEYIQSNQLTFSPTKLPTNKDDKTHILATRGQAQTRELIGEFTATAYTYTGHNAFTGVWPHRGIISVDQRVIPLGTKLYVDNYGFGVAADTGGAIKGSKLDLFFETYGEAKNWGRRQVKIYRLE